MKTKPDAWTRLLERHFEATLDAPPEGGKTVSQLMQLWGFSETSTRRRVAKLEAAGAVAGVSVKASRGPVRYYVPTDK